MRGSHPARRIGVAALALSAGGAIMITGIASAGPDPVTDAKNKFPKGSDERECDGSMDVAGMEVDEPGEDQIVLHGANVLWPPNHKYRTVEITADGDSASEDTELTTMVASDQPDNGLGDGNTTADANPTQATAEDANADGETDGDATTAHQLRAERSGKDPLKAGRTYTIVATATFDNGTDECMETFTVSVPHDLGNR